MEAKRLAAAKAVEYVKDGMVIGLGTGSTAYWAIQLIGERVSAGLNVQAVATSLKTETLARDLQIPIATWSDTLKIDLAIDGADEIDRHNNLIKGGGGALMREKIVAYNSKQFVVIADESKLVDILGAFPLPVEVLPFGYHFSLRRLRELSGNASIRVRENVPFVTDNGNFVIDCHFDSIEEPALLEEELKKIPGVLETGLFLKERVRSVIIGYQKGNVVER